MKNLGELCILIIDDSDTERTLYKEWLSTMNGGSSYRFIEASGGKTGHDAYAEYKPDCIILDFLMMDKDGFEILLKLRSEFDPLPPIIFVTGHHNQQIKEDALGLGACCYLNKDNMTAEKLHDAVLDAVSE